MAKENTFGSMAANILESGTKTIWKASGIISTKMVLNIMANISKTKSMDMVNITGTMAELIKDGGRVANSTV